MNLIKNKEEYFNNKSISVVGNGSSLTHNNYADNIDSSDIVIRFNHGILNYKQYKNIVGEKMDMIAVNAYSDGNHENIINYIKLSKKDILITRPLDRGLGHGLYVNDIFLETFNNINNNIIEIDKSIFLNNAMGDGYYNFTSGMITILFLSDFDCEIKVFGLDFLKNGYFFGVNELGGHSSEREQEIFNKIAKENKRIKLFK